MGEKLRERFGEKNIALGFTLFVTGAALICLYMVLNNSGRVAETLKTVIAIISPFIYGVVIAYLLSPLFDFLTGKFYALFKGKFNRHHVLELTVSKGIATFISMLVLILVIVGFGFLIIPVLIDSISSLVEVAPKSASAFVAWARSVGSSSTGMMALIHLVQISADSIVAWAKESLLPELGSIASSVSAGVLITVKTLLNILVGVITSVYLLNGREHFKAQFKKTAYALMTKERADGFVEMVRYINRTFGGFISGKIIDSIAIGFICYALMMILGLPYAVLVSCIIGITNVIPFFGPFIGAIPSVVIIAVVDPMQAIVFAVMILALQQFDGNILGPKILGDNTGLASFWVLFAIIIGGGLFGFIGMVLAVPTFAVVYYYLGRHVEKQLKEKGMPSDTSYYEHTDLYDPEAIKKRKEEKRKRIEERKQKKKKAKELENK